MLRMPAGRAAPGARGFVRVPRVPRGDGRRLALGVAVFAPGITATSVPGSRPAEANAAFDLGGYVPAGILPVATGYLADAVGLTGGATVFGAVVGACAADGGAFVLAQAE
ncbi:hypothetical protein [Actinomadura algeriensis]|uniref:MFS transporter n=1 Tax=Actinomadura algeriensis TaxID=1679523 RepID=A0ABR9JMS8_9ACTN|nr:hypothetical protein [Actinomadura algeriensis]MBE1531859.1 hypothetical protein [Actinomadura algeriensis]